MNVQNIQRASARRLHRLHSVYQSQEVRDESQQDGHRDQDDEPRHDGDDAAFSRQLFKPYGCGVIPRLLRLDWVYQSGDSDAGEPTDDAADGQLPVVIIPPAGRQSIPHSIAAVVFCVAGPRDESQANISGRVFMCLRWLRHLWSQWKKRSPCCLMRWCAGVLSPCL